MRVLEPYALPEDWRQAPVQSGHLEIEGHRVWWAAFGRSDGVPFIVVHGGPGSGSNLKTLTFFDPSQDRVIMFDQRGTGRSTPAGCLTNNTTWHLVADMERLRTHLRLPAWHVFGGSWGATLALIYAQCHPKATLSVTVRSVSHRHSHQTDWVLSRRPNLQPERAEFFLHGLTKAQRQNPVAARYAQIISNDTMCITSATRAVVSLEAGLRGSKPDYAGMLEAMATASEAQTRRARIFLHYWVNRSFLDHRETIYNPAGLVGIPCAMLHGAQDWVCPPSGAKAISALLPNACLTLVDDVGHYPFVPAMTNYLRRAILCQKN